MIVDDFDHTTEALKKAGYVISVTSVLGVAIPDRTGGLYEVLNSFIEAGVHVNTPMHLPVGKKGWLIGLSCR